MPSSDKHHRTALHCPVGDCKRLRSPQHLMCSVHWCAVPAQLRRRIWNLYRAAPGSADHREACHEAIRLAGGGKQTS